MLVKYTILISIVFSLLSCKEEPETKPYFIYGGDFSILKKMEDSGGVYKLDGEAKDALKIFTQNGYNYGRVRLFHTPNMEGPTCNSLEYTIELSKKIKASGMKLLLDIHYSDTWADPAHQIKPKAWKGLSFEVLTDSVYAYSKFVIEAMKSADVMPDMVQVGNEITPGMIWPDGKVWKKNGEDWLSLSTLLKAGINGVKDGSGVVEMPIMIHIDKGGDFNATSKFFNKIEENGVEYDIIGLSYYPWWHGDFKAFQNNISWLSNNKEQDIIIVETAYYMNGHYPDPGGWIEDVKPFPPTPNGQYDFLVTLDSIAHKFPKVKGIFYWKPDGLQISGTGVHFLGRSLFDKDGNALKGLRAFK